MPAAEVEVGSSANNYEILTKLAEGGMAEIFLARNTGAAGVARHVVLKRVLRERASDAQWVQMFLDEARLAAQLQHPNIAQVYDIGKLGDSYFFTMEYVHGETVRSLLHRAHGLQRPVPIPIVLSIIAGAAAGLQHAHELVGVDGKVLGIVHRDVSPSNLMVGYEGHVKLVDFGVAKATQHLHETRSGAVKGKVTYLSPEQCHGKAIDRRSDLFALGIVMWEMVTTERLYSRDSDFDNMIAISQEAIPVPSKHRPDVPPAVEAIVMKLLEKDPPKRYQTAELLLEDLERVAVSLGVALSPSSVGKFVRELFGQRPLPWLEPIQTKSVTVTSEPLPLELFVEVSDEEAAALLKKSGSLTVPTPIAGVPVAVLAASERSARLPTQATKDELVNLPSRWIPPATARIPESAQTDVLRRRPPSWLVIGGIALTGILVVAIVWAATRDASDPDPGSSTQAATEPPHDPAPRPPDVPPEPAPPQPAPRDRATELGALIAAKKFGDGFALCAKTPQLTGTHATECAIAACRHRDLTAARKWAPPASSPKRKLVVAACQEVRLVLDPPRVKRPAVDCAKDPLACPR